jgi:hypothetical protein
MPSPKTQDSKNRKSSKIHLQFSCDQFYETHGIKDNQNRATCNLFSIQLLGSAKRLILIMEKTPSTLCHPPTPITFKVLLTLTNSNRKVLLLYMGEMYQFSQIGNRSNELHQLRTC